MNPLELEGERMRKEELEEMAARKRPPFVVPDSIQDDWTGTRFLHNWWCYGNDPCPPRESKVQLSDESLIEVEAEADPYDPDLADVRKIMDRYAKKDHEKELYTKEHGNDTFGLDKISAASAAHGGDDDNKRIREIFDGYTTGAKGSNGLPNGERWVEKWNAELAAEEVIKEWVGDKISDGAMKKFLKDNFSKSWNVYDMYDHGHIDMFSAVPFMRNLMGSLSAPDAP